MIRQTDSVISPLRSLSVSTRLVRVLLMLSLLSISEGCQKKEQIKKYTVPQMAVVQSSTQSTPVPQRMLGAIVPYQQTTWYFKMVGQPDPVQQQLTNFMSFVNDLNFDKQSKQPTWKLPPDWKEEPGSGMRFATIKTTSGEAPLELSVISLPTSEGDPEQYLLNNINRWRNQIGMSPIAISDLQNKKDADDNIQTVELKNGLNITLINFLGAKSSGGSMQPPFANRMTSPIAGSTQNTGESPARSQPVRLNYNVPEQWKEEPATGMRKASFTCTAENNSSRKVEITIIDLTVGAGELLPNINRWRQQVNLDAIEEANLDKSTSPIKIDEKSGVFVELIGTGKPAKTILGVIVVAKQRSWFIKLTGDPELAAKEKQRFLKFCESVKF